MAAPSSTRNMSSQRPSALQAFTPGTSLSGSAITTGELEMGNLATRSVALFSIQTTVGNQIMITISPSSVSVILWSSREASFSVAQSGALQCTSDLLFIIITHNKTVKGILLALCCNVMAPDDESTISEGSGPMRALYSGVEEVISQFCFSFSCRSSVHPPGGVRPALRE